MELMELLEKKFLSLEELEQVEESPEVQSVEDCGMSGQYNGKHWYNVLLQDNSEYDIYTD